MNECPKCSDTGYVLNPVNLTRRACSCDASWNVVFDAGTDIRHDILSTMDKTRGAMIKDHDERIDRLEENLFLTDNVASHSRGMIEELSERVIELENPPDVKMEGTEPAEVETEESPTIDYMLTTLRRESMENGFTPNVAYITRDQCAELLDSMNDEVHFSSDIYLTREQRIDWLFSFGFFKGMKLRQSVGGPMVCKE